VHAPARHRKPFPRLPCALLSLLALLAAAAWIIPGTGAARAAPAARPAAAVLASFPDRSLAAAAGARSARAAAAARDRAAAAARDRAAYLAAHTYTVRPGDSLSAIAARHCGAARDWTGIYAASRARHWTARNANILAARQHLWLACAYQASQLRFAPAPPPPPRLVLAAVTVQSGYAAPASTYRSSYQAPVTYQGGSGFQSCVISRESGGNPRAVNVSSGAGGLYQFLPSTWQSLGFSGLPENASVAEQNAAFEKAYAESGVTPWRAYDGC